MGTFRPSTYSSKRISSHLGLPPLLTIRILDIPLIPLPNHMIFCARSLSIGGLLVVAWLSVVAHVTDVPPGGGPRGCGGEGSNTRGGKRVVGANLAAGLTTGVAEG